jgi:hypothetical protein
MGVTHRSAKGHEIARYGALSEVCRKVPQGLQAHANGGIQKERVLVVQVARRYMMCIRGVQWSVLTIKEPFLADSF